MPTSSDAAASLARWQDEDRPKEDEQVDMVDEDMSEDEEMGFEASDARQLNRGDEVGSSGVGDGVPGRREARRGTVEAGSGREVRGEGDGDRSGTG